MTPLNTLSYGNAFPVEVQLCSSKQFKHRNIQGEDLTAELIQRPISIQCKTWNIFKAKLGLL